MLLAVALAGPRTPDLRTRIEVEGVAVMMLVDVSGSMSTHDFAWQGQPISRLDAVKRVFRLFVAGGAEPDATPDGDDAHLFQGRPTDSIGLVVFATRPKTACPLTLSHSVLLRLLDDEQPRSVPGESETNLSDAVALGLYRLKSAGARRKVLVLLTDGEHNVPDPRSGWTPRQAAQIAASLDVPIYTIDAGGDAGAPEPGVAESPGDSPALVRAAGRRDAGGHGQDHARPILPGGRHARTAGRLPGHRPTGANRRVELSIPPLPRGLSVVRGGGAAAVRRGAGAGFYGLAAIAMKTQDHSADALLQHWPLTDACSLDALYLLALLPALGALLAWDRWRTRRALARLGSPASLLALVESSVRRRFRRGTCVVLGVVALTLGTAGPQWGCDWDESAAPGAIWSSSSIAAAACSPRRPAGWSAPKPPCWISVRR